MTVWTIPAGVSFLDALAAGIVADTRGDPAALARITVLLPTRRAGRALREAFLRQTGGAALLLPRVQPLGDVDDDELALSEGIDGADIPPAIAPLRRRLVLARAILALEPRESSHTAPQAVELAAELAHLLDEVQTAGIGFGGLEKLAPEEHAEHWRRTVEFLKILTAQWPKIIEGEGALDPADRRNRVLKALRQSWEAHPPPGRVIAAGSTGSIPATAELLKLIAGLKQGDVVLPGLDRDLDEKSWEALEPTHPQYGLRELLRVFDMTPAEVKDWPHPAAPASADRRRRFISAAFLPAETAESWRDLKDVSAESLAGMSRIDAAHPQQEAQAIALMMREALETEARTAALVTPDRDLARRVAAELGRFGLSVDDSAGRPLAATPPLVFLRLVAEAMAEGAPPAKLLAVFKHPFAAGGLAPAAFRARARELEVKALRGPRPGPGLAAMLASLRQGKDAALADWFEALIASARDFEALTAGEAKPPELLRAHVALAEAWARSDTDTGAARLWAGDAGEAAADFIAEFADTARDFPAIAGSGYPALFDSCVAGRVVRPAWGGHPRLHILGPLEARLLSFDVTILGGLNEGTWPRGTLADPWMSRPMRGTFGLPELERAIGLAAHDVAQGMAAPTVVLTRAARVEGTPTVPSRWLQRVDAVLKAAGLTDRMNRRPEILAWQGKLDESPALPPLRPPAPRPPVAARPRRLSVTEIETWRRDPYVIYAKHVLKLRALDPLDADPGAADRGRLVHESLDEFINTYRAELPPDALKKLLVIGERHFAAEMSRPGVWAFWWPRFEAVAAWFVAQEQTRRPQVTPLIAEVSGRLTVNAGGKDFTLVARADRIDRVADGSLSIIDYKTGGKPDLREVAEGYLPQLPLEAAIAASGGFAGVAAAPVTQLRYWHVPGGDPAGTEIALDGGTYGKERTKLPAPAALAEAALSGLKALIARFDDPETAYLARPRADRAPRYNDYAHLARIQEWSAEGET